MNITNPNILDIYSLTPLQEGILFHSIMNERSNSEYIVQQIIKFGGPLNIEYINSALEMLFEKHEILRTIFLYEKLSSPKQIVLKHIKPQFSFYDFSLYDKQTKEKTFNELGKNEIDDGFMLSKGPLLKVICVKYDENLYKIIWTVHHIILDGWSLAILFSDFMHYYDLLFSADGKANLISTVMEEKKHMCPFKNYINWINKQESAQVEQFWKSKLKGYEGTIHFETGIAVNNKQKSIEKLEKSIEKDIFLMIKKFAIDKHITINTILECAVGIVLQKLSNQKDIVFGKVVSGRDAPLSNIDTSTGLYINTIPFRLNTDSSTSINDLLLETFKSDINTQKYEHFSLSKIQDMLPQKNNLINVLYCFENYYYDSTLFDRFSSQYNFELESYREETNYDLTIQISYQESSLNMLIMFNNSNISKEFAESFLNRIVSVLNEICSDSIELIDDISINLRDDESKILIPYNNTDKPYNYCTLHELFIKSAKLYPNNIAIIHNNKTISYKELYHQSKKVYKYIKCLNIKPNSLIAVASERKIETIIMILGILMSGCTYIPININDPIERQETVINKCKPSLVLNSQIYNNYIKDLLLDKRINIYTNYNSLAYVIFTSGSTGNPKGVMISHKSAVNTILDINNRFNINNSDNFLCLSSFCFDLSVYDIFGSLSVGASITIVDDAKKINEIKYIINENKITIWNSVPAIMEMYIDNIENEKNSLLRYVFLSGDWIPVNLPNKIKNSFIKTEVISLGGATEASIWSIFYVIPNILPKTKSIPYGKPLSNQKLYVLDKNLKQCPIDVKGEIYISGLGIAQGYLHDTELTNNAFVYSKQFGRIYKTGDYGVLHRNGQMEILGRTDHQVKINGYRVEIGDIENNLKQIEQINNAAVVFNKSLNKIIAYFTANVQINCINLKKELKNKLPNYMIPSQFIQLDKLPTNNNGKVDRMQLKSLYEMNLIKKKNDEIILDNTEKIIYDTLMQLIDIDFLDVTTNFLEIGLDSIKTIKFSGILNKKGINVSIKEVFQNPTISSLSDYVNSRKELINIKYFDEKIKNNNSVTIPYKELIKQYSSVLNDFDILNYYWPSKFQIENFDVENTMLYSFPINENIDNIAMALFKVICEQSAFRSTYRHNNETIEFVEKNINQKINIPYFKNINVNYKTYITNCLKTDKLDLNDIFFPGSPLVIPIIVEFSDCTSISIIANHSVWDLKSNDIFKSRVLFYLENKQTDIEKVTPISNIITARKKTQFNFNKQDMFFKEKSNYEKKINEITSKTCFILECVDTHDFLTRCNYDLASFALKLLRTNHKLNVSNNKNIPFYYLKHGRNEENNKICGPMVELLPAVISSDSISDENIFTGISISENKNYTFQKEINLLPIINISIDMDDVCEHKNDTIKSCNLKIQKSYKSSYDIFIRVCNKETIIVIFTSENSKDELKNTLQKLIH